MNYAYLLTLPLILFGCASDNSTSHYDAADWISEELIESSQRAGTSSKRSYSMVVTDAMNGDQDALSQVFNVSPFTDAAASESQAGILAKIIRTIGDDSFALALKSETTKVIESNLSLVSDALSGDSNYYPHTMSLK